jgi:hypothetical protein
LRSSFTTCLLVSEEDETVIEVLRFIVIRLINSELKVCINALMVIIDCIGRNRETRKIYSLL